MTHQNENKIVRSCNTSWKMGLDGLPEALRIIINEAMRIQRSKALRAQPYERTDQRQGYANGFKEKTIATRIGKIRFSVPQVRGDVDFYPSALEKGWLPLGWILKAGAPFWASALNSAKPKFTGVTSLMATPTPPDGCC